MNWDQISSIAEIIEAVVIIVSLIYLALQVRQNTQTTRATAAQAQMDGYAAVIASIGQTKENARVWHRGLASIKKLKGAENVQFFVQCNLFIRLIETSYFQHKSGALDRPLWQGLERGATDFVKQKGMQQFLEVRKHWYSDEFQVWLKKAAQSKTPSKNQYPGLKTSK